MGKVIKQAQLNDIMYPYLRDDISASKACELINEIAENFAIGFKNWCAENEQYNKSKSTKELLEIYKKTL